MTFANFVSLQHSNILAAFRQTQAPGSTMPHRLYVPTTTSKETRAINRSKWEPLDSPFLPESSPEWAAALCSVDKHAPFRNLIPREECGTMFPDPGYFAVISADKTEAAVAAWLYTRAARCGQMLHPFSGRLPTANAATWRKFFWIYAYRWPEPADTPVPVSKRHQPHVIEHYEDAVDAAKAMFGTELVANMRQETSQVFHHDVDLSVVQGRAMGLTPRILKRITWELAELNWCYELLALDRVVALERWRMEDDESSARLEMVKDVFKPGRDFVWWNSEFPTQHPSITALTIGERLAALRALRRLMVHWMDCPPALQVSLPFNATPEAGLAFERSVLHNYCHTFYVHFGRPPIIPMCLPL